MELLAEINKPVEWQGLKSTLLSIYRSTYHDGNMAILGRFRFDDGMEEELVLSVNIVDEYEALEEEEFFLKNWSERAGMLDALVEAEVIEYSGVSIPYNFIEAPIVHLICDEIALLKQSEDDIKHGRLYDHVDVVKELGG